MIFRPYYIDTYSLVIIKWLCNISIIFVHRHADGLNAVVSSPAITTSHVPLVPARAIQVGLLSRLLAVHGFEDAHHH